MPELRVNTAKLKLQNNQVVTAISWLQDADTIDFLQVQWDLRRCMDSLRARCAG